MNTETITVEMKEADWENFRTLISLNAKEAELDPYDKSIYKYTLTVTKEKR